MVDFAVEPERLCVFQEEWRVGGGDGEPAGVGNKAEKKHGEWQGLHDGCMCRLFRFLQTLTELMLEQSPLADTK